MDMETYNRIQKDKLKKGWPADTNYLGLTERLELGRDSSMSTFGKIQLSMPLEKKLCLFCEGNVGMQCSICNGLGYTYH